MAVWIVGDVQGCFEPLQRLLDRVGFEPGRDELWSVGDLVNRGPGSLETLRFFAALGDAATVVLGNHDLHLLAVAAGVVQPKRGDTLQSVLDAPDRDELLAWLRTRPLLVEKRGVVLVHAGLHPRWSLDDARHLANLAEQRLRSPGWAELLTLSRSPEAAQVPTLGANDDLLAATALSVMTRIRICDADGVIDHRFKDEPERIPPGFFAWFDAPHRRWAGADVVFGHWAALGQRRGAGWTSLDAGCVWGQSLCMMRLDTREVVSVPAVD
jgi:bis(5'-nucleosyl)-tetraphosphatase (symmetrical)